MLPSIDAQQRRELSHNGVLIGICADQNLTRLVVLDEPSPAATLNTSERSIELRLEGGKVLIARLNCCLSPCISLVPTVS